MADPAISDTLFDRYPLPPVPESQPSDLLGAFFGAAPDRTKSYAAGLDAGSTYRLRSAQGEKALEEAHMEREKRLTAEMGNSLRLKIQKDPNYQPTVSEMLLVANGAKDFTDARGGFQEQGFRSTLGDPAASPEAQFAAGQGVQGKVLPQVQALGTGREINMMTQDAYTNPVGTAGIQEDVADAGASDALTNLRNRTDPNIRSTSAAGSRLPPPVMKIVDDATQSLGAAAESENTANSAINILKTSGVNLGLADNTINRGKNFLGLADPASTSYAAVQQAFEKLRNNYLLLAKGVQTEGDATRAWNSEIGEAAAYDNTLAEQQLTRALALIEMNRQLQHRRIQGVFTTYGQPVPGMYDPNSDIYGFGAKPPPPAAPPGAAPPAAAPPAAAPASGLSPAEQAELEQLRAELGGG